MPCPLAGQPGQAVNGLIGGSRRTARERHPNQKHSTTAGHASGSLQLPAARTVLRRHPGTGRPVAVPGILPSSGLGGGLRRSNDARHARTDSAGAGSFAHKLRYQPDAVRCVARGRSPIRRRWIQRRRRLRRSSHCAPGKSFFQRQLTTGRRRGGTSPAT